MCTRCSKRPRRKNALLKEVLEKVVYQKLNEKRKKSPDGFIIEIYPRIPKSEK